MTIPLLQWQKRSYKRYTAPVGPLTIEVRRRKHPSMIWFVRDVFGVIVYEEHDGTLEGAQFCAEQWAKKILQQATAFIHVRECAGGPPMRGRPNCRTSG